MAKRSILHMFDPMSNNSPFDVNMALDCDFDVLIPYANVQPDSMHRMTQDVIFSRGPKGVKQTGIFIGGRDIGVAIDMLNSAKKSMVPPFEVSVLADPSGAFTTAAALVACVEKELNSKFNKQLKDCKALVFGGTGPVGIATGVIASLAGADAVLVDHFSGNEAQGLAEEYNRRFDCKLSGTVATFDDDKIKLIEDADLIFCTAKAGIQILSADVLGHAKQLKVVGDVNAVPPAGIAGVQVNDFGVPLANTENAVAIGPLAVGNIKYKVQHALLSSMLSEGKPVYLDFIAAFEKAKEILAK
ncbi:methylene-tetrahydromethanopterin dehydrogenase [Bathymodiolus platifrons methanotrophic gill symbiont]|uniref:NAD(P)-dependent methylenetetrahydromethanopterin dehydrogenase n=1 Tax=Bathymodiolus platifrons methanotrophic gill symbiont TaxID=113268 RepID=UPI000B41B3F0|nr:NAD(P)-dependent methylenetetrahydromethanopterin dehydrogenase [Bathymodiolus platifrons methanotrophic gill symbiont]MCK5870723.1 methylenetetrahydromethanopterin dehydrogenase [Methyloprofundus sp.]TXK98552.1 methylenetetrahydromethanopterin dehydrogenase [Methylococcaceae bacterium CS4]TXL00523.1 methylenetetrahydromethanopterin dehydrogenase [Methylococcaceae bacterium CS5]TXL03636.1 methylenetetrahydromethanopterin dehydrogenase [Methylococcaceae bacterium CS3]TXL07860.1 methylenetetr